MSWLRKIATDLNQVVSDDDQFETGKPVRFPYLKNTEPAPDMGERFQQHIEPAGKYIIHNETESDALPPWQSGDLEFRHPLVIAFNSKPDNSSYDEYSWKYRLSQAYGGKSGIELSKAIIADGYDGIVTVYIDHEGKPRYTKEIVDLRPIIESYQA